MQITASGQVILNASPADHSAAPTLAFGDGDTGPFAMTANGHLMINDGGGSVTVDGTVTANLSATDGVGEIRKVVKVAVRGSGKTHISEVQIVGDF